MLAGWLLCALCLSACESLLYSAAEKGRAEEVLRFIPIQFQSRVETFLVRDIMELEICFPVLQKAAAAVLVFCRQNFFIVKKLLFCHYLVMLNLSWPYRNRLLQAGFSGAIRGLIGGEKWKVSCTICSKAITISHHQVSPMRTLMQ